MFPALSAPRLSPWSRCRAIRINLARGLMGLTRKPPATAPANKRPMPRAALSPTRTACLVPVPRLPVACRRTMHFHSSCGPPNPAADAGLRDHGRVFPALSAARPLPWSRYPLTATVPLRARQMRQEVASGARSQDRDRRGLPAAPSRTPTRSLVRLARPVTCRRTTPSRLSCDAHDKGQRVVRRQR